MPQINLILKKELFNPIYLSHLFDYSKRYEVYYGGAGSGKSAFVFQKAVVKACNSKRKFLVVRKTAKSNANSTFQMLLDILSSFKIAGLCKVNRTNFTVTLPNGSAFLFYGLDDAEKIKSIAGITDIICEECTELSLDDVTQLDLRLRANAENLQMFFMFNPTSKENWVYKRWFAEDAEVDYTTTSILRTTYKDNKFLPQEYIESLEAMINTNPTYYKIYALGEFCSLDKLVFRNWKVEEFNHADIQGKLLCGLDFGFVNDPTAFVASVLVEEEKRIYVFKEWVETNKTNEEIAKVIAELGFVKSVVIADSAEQKSIEEIRRNGVSRIRACAKGPDSIIHGLTKLQEYQIIVHPSCFHLITELENYSWQKNRQTGEYINKPIDSFNHCIDALRYSLQCAESNKLKTINKSLLGL